MKLVLGSPLSVKPHKHTVRVTSHAAYDAYHTNQSRFYPLLTLGDVYSMVEYQNVVCRALSIYLSGGSPSPGTQHHPAGRFIA